MKFKENNKPGPVVGTQPNIEVNPIPSPLLPEWVPPNIDDTSRLAASEIKEPREYTFLSADDAIIPEAFGHCVLTPRYASVVPSGANILLRCIWCRGEQGSMTLYAGNELFTGTVTHYLGAASQTPIEPNAALVSAIAGYSDTLDGICYSVVTLPGNRLDLANSLVMVVNGREVADPRTVPTNLSSNPALCYYYVATAVGLTVDTDSIKAAADYCDEVIPTTSVKRWTWGMVFDQPEEIERQLKLIAEYAGCYHVRDGGTVKLVPDRATATTATFSDAQADIDAGASMIVANSLRLSKKPLDALPNQSRCQYTNTDKFPWRRPYATTATPTGDIRQTSYNMHGFRNYNTAKRFGNERQNKFDLCDLKVSFESFDESLSVETGDVIELTHNVGLTDQKFRVLGIGGGGAPGRWVLNCEKYDATINSDATDAEPTYADITLPDPSDVPNGPTPTVTDVNYTDEMGFTYSILSIDFTGVSWMFADSYRVVVYFGSFVVLETTVKHLGAVTHTVPTPAVEQGALYTIEVYVLNAYGDVSDTPGTATKMADGKALGPSNVPDTVTATENGYFITVDWEAATDSDLKGYVVKRLNQADYEAALDDNARWNHVNAVTLTDRCDQTLISVRGQPTGFHYYGVKAIDMVYPKAGHESVTARWDMAEVTVDAGIGNDGYNTAVIMLYKRTATNTADAVPNNNITYTFSTAGITGSLDGWSTSVPAASESLPYLWVTSAVAKSRTDDDVVAAAEWAAPVIQGEDGIQVHALFLYKRAATAGADPGTLTYTFATGVLTGTLNGWSQAFPGGSGDPVWSIQATAIATTIATTDTIASAEWSTAAQVVQDGADGSDGVNGVDGNDGNSVAQLFCYKRGTSSSTPTGGSFNFDTNVLTPPSGWSVGIPAGTDPVYVSYSSASINGTSGTDSSLTWSLSVKLAEDGADGADGAVGVSTFHAPIYRRLGSTPATPSGGSFNFGTNALTPPSLWYTSVPAGSLPIYISSYQFSITGDTGTDTAGTWAAPKLMAQDGSDGADGADGDTGLSTYAYTVYRRSATAPSTPTGGSYSFTSNTGTPPSLWSNEIPAVNGNPCYASTAVASVSGPTGVDSSLTWSTRQKIVEDGADGSAGADGADGADGDNAITTQLSIPAFGMNAASDGTGYSITPMNSANKQDHKVYSGSTDVTTSAVQKIVGGTDLGSYWTKGQNGITLVVEESTGKYYLSGTTGWTTDSEQWEITQTYGGVTYTKLFTITKAKDGVDASSGAPVVELEGRYIASSSTTATNPYSTFYVDNDGALHYGTHTVSKTSFFTWLISGSASDYDVKVTVTEGSLSSGSTTGAWLNCGTDRSWTRNDTTASSTTGSWELVTLEVKIRDATSHAILDICTVTLRAWKKDTV